MQKLTYSTFDGELEVVATLANGAILASIEELRQRDKLTIAMRQLIKQGVSVEEISAATGLTVEDIERRVTGELHLDEDIADLAGTR